MKQKNQNMIMYIALLFVAVIFLYFFSKGTSPLYANLYYGEDGAIFMTMGQLLLDGKVPYLDFFDHKGPLLIFIEALGLSLLEGRYGIFILQIINLFFILAFAYKICKIFTNSVKQQILGILTFLFFVRFTFGEGNLSEEYSVLYAVIALYIALKYYYVDKKLSVFRIIVLGLCFCIPFWIRANNAGFSSACIAFLFFLLFKDKNWKMLTKYTLVLLATFVAFSGAICLYFYMNDALYEMYYANFLFNFKYTLNTDMSKVDAHKKIFFPALSAVIILTLIIGVYLSYRKKKDNNVIVLFLLCILFGFLPMCMGPLNGHYLMMIQPILLLGVAFILQSQQFAEITDKFFPAFLIILVLMLAVSFQFKRNFFNTRNITFAPKAISIASCIPEDEKSETYCYLVPGVFYVITDIKPISKYFIFQEFHGSADNHILKEINQQVEKNKPKWLIVGTSNPDDLQNKEFVNILKSNYSLYKEEVGDQEALVLYRLNEAE